MTQEGAQLPPGRLDRGQQAKQNSGDRPKAQGERQDCGVQVDLRDAGYTSRRRDGEQGADPENRQQ